MLKLLLFSTLLILPAMSVIRSPWKLRCYMYSSQVRKWPYHSEPHFKYCAIQYFEKKDGYDYISTGYNYIIGNTNDKLIDEQFERNNETSVVRVEKVSIFTYLIWIFQSVINSENFFSFYF